MANAPYSRYYTPLSKNLRGNVEIPGPNDPVDVSQQGNMTFMDFGALPAEVRAFAPQRLRTAPSATTPPTSNATQEYNVPYQPQMDLLDQLILGGTSDRPYMPPGMKPSRPTESYGINRGGTGKAGRGKSTSKPLPQFGQSQFDTGPGYEPLEMSYSEISDKPWELDENTNVDVSPGTSLTPKPETNIVDKEPDLQSPRGMYEALAKKYPDILTQNLDQLQQGRVTMEDVDALRDQSGLGSLFIAASKAASGAGSIGGKTAESIAPTIVQREDTLARQRLKDRMDVASENMALNAKAVDLAMKQINFADEREQYDPNSEVSKFARDFMRDEFQVNVPDDVPAYQLKQFLPAIVQKYQAKETGAYRNAMLQSQGTYRQQMLEARTAENMLNDAFKRYDAALKSGDRQAAIQAKKDIAEMQALKKGQPKAAKDQKVTLTPQEKLQNELVKDDAKVYQKRMQGLQKLDGGLKSLDDAKTPGEVVQIGQSLLKTLNDTENSDAVGAEEVKRLASELQPFSLMTPNALVQIGRDLSAFKQRVKVLRERLYNTLNIQFQSINQKMPDLVDPPPTYGTSAGAPVKMLPSGKAPLTEAERAKLKRLRELKGVK